MIWLDDSNLSLKRVCVAKIEFFVFEFEKDQLTAHVGKQVHFITACLMFNKGLLYWDANCCKFI